MRLFRRRRPRPLFFSSSLSSPPFFLFFVLVSPFSFSFFQPRLKQPNEKPVRQLRTALESEFNCDLGSHKALLRETVDAFLAEKQPKEEEEEEEAEAEAEEAASSSSSEDDEEEPAPKKAKTSAKGKGGAAKAKGSGGGGFQKPLKLSPAMQQFTGEERLSRAQIVKKCWVRLTFRFLSFSPSLVVVVVFVIFVVVVSFSVLSRTLSRNAYKKKETNPF